MRFKYLFAVLALGLSFGNVDAQVNLKDLRVKPDTTISINKQEDVTLKNIRPIIPKLELTVDYWKHWTRFGVTANQAYFNEDWKGGGVNSLALGFNVYHKSDYTKDNFNFVTELDLRYGRLKNKDQMAKKNNDRIFWDNKVSYKFSKNWSLFTSLTYETQFDVGYTYGMKDGRDSITGTVSAFMAPGYLTESLGLEYKPNAQFSLRLGTGTARQTFILDDRIKPLTVEEYKLKYPERKPITADQVRYGVEAGKSFKNDLAFQITANLDKNIAKNLNLKSRYNLFANYNKLEDPSHRLDVTLTAKVTSLVNVTMNGVLIYDSDVVSKVQASETLALGITYSLPR